MDDTDPHPPFALRPLIAECARRLESAALAKGMLVDLTYGIDTESFRGDRERLAQVLCQLGRQAIRFAERGDLEIVARGATGKDDRDNRVAFEVRVLDPSLEVSAEHLKGLLDEATCDNPTAPLSECGRTIMALGGHLRATGERGRGAAFEFDIPLIAEPVSPSAQPATRSTRQSGVDTEAAVRAFLCNTRRDVEALRLAISSKPTTPAPICDDVHPPRTAEDALGLLEVALVGLARSAR